VNSKLLFGKGLNRAASSPAENGAHSLERITVFLRKDMVRTRMTGLRALAGVNNWCGGPLNGRIVTIFPFFSRSQFLLSYGFPNRRREKEHSVSVPKAREFLESIASNSLRISLADSSVFTKNPRKT